MKAKIIIPLLVILSICSLKAQEAPSQHFRQAFEEISAMLDGKQPLDFEKAVFITENAYRDNSLNFEDFKSALNVHSAIIEQFIKANDKYDWRQFVRGNMGIAPDMEIEAKERYRKALSNYAIFTYLTDTLTVKLEGQNLLHLPYTYSNDDPFGTADWENSQTINLLETQKGNCYSLVTLFKILSERFKSEANIVTAPQHIYIEHRDPKGSRFNVEVATRSFPDMGSIQTLTYTTREALLNDISMRKLDLKQSVGLNLVYLAKGYEYKNKVKDDEFILTCANTALQHDPKNLNALLLKAQVYEQRVMKKQMPSAPYEKMLAEFYKLGYRQMPDDMKEIILSKIQGRPSTVTPTDKTPNTFADIGERSRTVTLSNGLFEEHHTPQKIVRYGQTIFDTEKSKIVKFLDEENSSYQVDPVVFALSVDPLTKSYPMLTPYQFASNTPITAIDLDGLEASFDYASMAKALKTFKASDVKNETHKQMIILSQPIQGSKNPETWTDIDVYKNYSKEKLFEVKYSFIKDYKEVIHNAAKQFDIPPILLAGVAHTEFGGDPPTQDDIVYAVRFFGLLGGNERKTSFGDLSMQVRTAMETLEYSNDPSKRLPGVENEVIKSLKNPLEAFYIAAKHLSDLRDVDFKGKAAEDLSEDDLKIILARYNQGSGKSLEKIKMNLSYGNAVMNKKEKIEKAIEK